MKHLFVAAALLSLLGLGGSASAEDATRILVVVGPSDHPPGTHEVAAGGRVMKHCLENMTNLPNVKVDVHHEWPKDKAVRDSAATIVFIGDNFPPNRLPNPEQNLIELGQMMDRGCGIVCIHYATGLLGKDVKPDGDHPLLRWMGGYFAHASCPHHESFARIFASAKITPAAPKHPISRGFKEFTLHDEPYYNNYFGKDGNKPASNVTVVATSMLPPNSPKPEPVAWCVERPDQGRGYGIVMPHYYRNWKNDSLRKLILNGIVWTAKREIPEVGIQTEVPDLASFNPGKSEP